MFPFESLGVKFIQCFLMQPRVESERMEGLCLMGGLEENVYQGHKAQFLLGPPSKERWFHLCPLRRLERHFPKEHPTCWEGPLSTRALHWIDEHQVSSPRSVQVRIILRAESRCKGKRLREDSLFWCCLGSSCLKCPEKDG